MRAIFIALLGLGLTVPPSLAAPSRGAAAVQRPAAKPAATATRAAPSRLAAVTASRGASSRAPVVAARSGASRAPSAGKAFAARPALGRVAVAGAKTRMVVQAGASKARGAHLAKAARGSAKLAYAGQRRFGLIARAQAAPVTRAVRWTHGLEPAAGVQAGGCPAGTMATLARGHDDVVRCLPI